MDRKRQSTCLATIFISLRFFWMWRYLKSMVYSQPNQTSRSALETNLETIWHMFHAFNNHFCVIYLYYSLYNLQFSLKKLIFYSNLFLSQHLYNSLALIQFLCRLFSVTIFHNYKWICKSMAMYILIHEKFKSIYLENRYNNLFFVKKDICQKLRIKLLSSIEHFVTTEQLGNICFCSKV